ncbi:PucR family transcriptional regulator ligand-binding domain-containing protein [Streptomyces sp. TRM68367]|uniref:PucR family transcriptional regulator n=1 Tax=Streptomyces sp. TRM68367 TaxID=2758415 RepID=UPI00165C0413|nr:PucR family transcriptional regulator ligand-binding domain-containing protein [Streptomyces sp. TRM68367]MBC9728544.1 PucR family transcriptional regulator ligand-binding domain-containing protein [Streptomyces sp. TRM68367]
MRRFITIRDVLRLPVLVEGMPRVLAGESRLDRAVRWVHVTELLNPANFLEGGELVLTTGMPYPEDTSKLRDYVDQLADVGAAGLIVELGYRYQKVPEQLVAACRARDVPLVELARGVRFIDVTQTVHALILDAQGELLRRGRDIQDIFTALTLRGATPEEVVHTAAELTGAPVVLEDLAHRVMMCELLGRPYEPVVSAWSRRSRAAPTLEKVAPSGPEGWLIAPVEDHQGLWGRLILLDSRQSPDADPEAVLVLERAVVALTMARLAGPAWWERRAHRSVLRDLCERRFRSPADARARAEALGLPSFGHRLFAVLIRHTRIGGEDEHLDERIAKELERTGVRALVGETAPGRIGVLLALARASAWQPVAERIGRLAHEELGPDSVVAVGPGVTDLSGIARSWQEAEETADAIVPGSPDRRFYVPSDIGLPELLGVLSDDTRLQRYAERRLTRLIEHDDRNGGDLLAALRAYVTAAGNKSVAAKQAGMSRQAFYQRLHTIERLLGCDLESGLQRTGLHVALLVLDSRGRAAPGI